MAFWRSRVWVKSVCFVAIAIFAAALCLAFRPVNSELKLSAKGQPQFSKTTLESKLFRLFDLGVADIDSDDQLDIFTSNHSNEQFLLINQGQGKFSENQVVPRNLSQDKEFPGLEYSLQTRPKPSKPGLYIYWEDRRLNIEAHNLKDPGAFAGNISVWAPLEIQAQRGLESEVTFKPFGDGEVSSSLNFKATQANGKLTFLAENVALPFIFLMNDSAPLDQIYVGNNDVSPTDARFDLFMRDRHGMAWRDINNDGKLDVYIVRGALKDRIDKLPGTFADELLIQEGDRFFDKIDPNEIKKGNCPSLQTAWVDANVDQQLDIFTLCYKPARPIKTFPPQLYVQEGSGKYQEEAAKLKLDLKEDGSFFWLDVDSDGDLDLFRSTSPSFILFRNDKGSFTQEMVAENPGGVAKTFNGSNSLSVADFDNDGDLDIFAASEQGNALLKNDQGNLTLISAKSVGLPEKGLTAHWVDYDNDGFTDLYSLPDGLYHQGRDHQFQATSLLKNQSSTGLLEARATWFDADNDGDRDLITAVNFRDPSYRRFLIKTLKQKLTPNGWFLDEYLNQSSNQNHWLTFDLKGKPENAEAIGAQLEIMSDLGTQKFMVGQSEGSHYSQGHYRLYAGLGGQTKPITIQVRWPDGTTQRQEIAKFDQRITLTQVT